MNDNCIESAITIDQLRSKVNEWERLHNEQLKYSDSNARKAAASKRDAIGEELLKLGFTPCYSNDQLVLIVH